jgi:hypothetical protein
MKPTGKANQQVLGFEQNGPGALEPGPKIMKAQILGALMAERRGTQDRHKIHEVNKRKISYFKETQNKM